MEIGSRPGVGTTATVYLAAAAPSAGPAELAIATDQERAPGGPRRLLLVEDEEQVRRTTARALERFGYAVDLAGNGKEAESLVLAGPGYDLIVSDVLMPVMSGLDLTRAIRAHGIMTPVLLVSGYSIDDVAEFRRTIPNVGALGKPWSLGQLAGAIEQLIEAAAPPISSG